MQKGFLSLCGLLLLGVPAYAASPVIISEFMAANSGSIKDEDGERPDWIEIHNITTNTVNLMGWSLTDATNLLTKWQFPATNIGPDGYIVVFASNKDRRAAGAPLHTNFRLDNEGEYLALVQPDGVTIATEFSPQFPVQITDVSYGYATDARDVVLVNTNAPARALVPANDIGTAWGEIAYPDSTWSAGTLGAGYDNNPSGVDYNPYLGLNVGSMFNVNQTVYIRVPFVVTNVAEIDTMSLTMLYDDGMIAYLNGHEIARDNAPTVPLWNSGAPANRADGTAITPTNFNVTAYRDFLQVGTNVLSFQGLNNGVGSSDLLLVPKLIARTRPTGLLTIRYFPTATPGTANNDGVGTLGPLLSDAQFAPNTPQTNQPVTVTVRVKPAFAPVAQVRLRYRVMYNAETEIPMADDGAHGDGLANDGVYGATIPAGIAGPGQMIRWYVRALDTSNVLSRVPAFADPIRSPEYFGTIVPVAQTNNLEILHWFIQNATGADNAAGSRASLFYMGHFYDNVAMNLHGQSSAGFPKKSYDVGFNRGDHFLWKAGEKLVSDVNILTTYPDKAQMRNMLAYQTFHDAGTPYHFVIPIRIHQNGTFWGDAHMVENGDADFLERLGIDVNGAFYKMYNQLYDATGEKKTRKFEGTADLQALINGAILPAGATRTAFLFDNINVPECINYLAAQTLTGNVDCCHKNYYLYRDTEGTGEWQIFPWDLDLSFGRVWSSATTYWDDVLYANTRLFVGDNNSLMIAIYGTPELRQMYLRRVRTLMDTLLGPPGTPASQGNYERQVDAYLAMIAPDAAMDLAKWGTWCCSGAGPYTQANIPIPANYQTLAQAANQIKNEYLPARRTFLYTNQIAGGGGEIPQAMPAFPFISITGLDYSPASSNQAQEYIEMRNTNAYAVDISGWRLSGGIDFTFAPGTVMSANSFLYVSPDVRAFRARTVGPRGGQGLFVQGPYKGELSARGETVRLEDRAARIVATNSYPGTPSLVEQYLRITELMYHPSPLSGNTNSAEEYEYIELKNIGPVSISLLGVRFTNGISFNFTGSSVTTLGAGQTVLIVKNLAAFTARYGSGLSIAGQYEGYLDNSGERIELLDPVGEEILDFSYNNSWYPITDGLGFSLVVVDELAEPDSWDLKLNWRASARLQGSPGVPDPVATTFAPVLVNEVLSRTTGVPDAIELYNGTTNSVDISGWFLTDDFATPGKYRIPNGTILGPGTYRVFTESNFNANPALSNSFALSSDGDEAYLFGADVSGNLNGYYHGFSFGAAEEGVSFGRYVSSDGKEHFVLQSAVTLNASNAGPQVGPIVISEIMYHPPDAGTNDNTGDEFIELLNISAGTVALYDPARPTNTWQITGGVEFTFPTNVSLAAGEALLVANFAPTNGTLLAAFRSKYTISPSIQVYGPYNGVLNNDSDSVHLRKPTPPLTNGVVPFPLVDSVEYSDSPPWPQAADGLGFSLQRWNVRAFGDDPANWVTTRPTAGALTVTNGEPPRITSFPTNITLLAGQDLTLAPTVTGSAPLTYQWRINGTNIAAATNLNLAFAPIQVRDAGSYELIVYNQVGAIFSQPVKVTVRIPIAITQMPQSIEARIQPDPLAAATTNVTFSVGASSLGTIRYQWRRNGVDIPGQTNASLSIVNVTTNDLAYFSAAVSDEISSAETTNVYLYPLISPLFIETPIAQSVAVGAPVTLSTLVSGWPPPFTFEWRIGAATVSTEVTDNPYAFYSFLASPTVGSISYRAVVRNRAFPSGRASPFAAITTLADLDADGIPDEWETRYGLLPNDALDRLADPDGDGMANWQEYMAGTDPTNRLSKLNISTMSWSNGVLNMAFDAKSNKTYGLEFKTSLSDTNWQSLSRIVASRSNHLQSFSDGLATTNRFYRLVTPAP